MFSHEQRHLATSDFYFLLQTLDRTTELQRTRTVIPLPADHPLLAVAIIPGTGTYRFTADA